MRATLSLSLGTPNATSARSSPAWRASYSSRMGANVISTAGDAALSVADRAPTLPGRLVNGAFVMPQALQARANAANPSRRSLRSEPARWRC